jgi:hypothetical protein
MADGIAPLRTNERGLNGAASKTNSLNSTRGIPGDDHSEEAKGVLFDGNQRNALA